MQVANRKISRKEMIKLGALGSAALFLPLSRVGKTVTIADRIPESRLPAPFRVGFVRPPVLKPVKRTATTDFYQVTMRRAYAPILPGYNKTLVYGYNGMTPGPTIHARQGRKTVVRQINRLRGPHTSVHLHGSDSLPQFDGFANDVTGNNQFKDYHYPNDQDARTLWYHDHGVHETAHNAYMGLAAQYHLRDAAEDRLPIPKGKYDVPLMIKDAIFARNGQLIYEDAGHSSLSGDINLVNGRPWPVMKVERRKYRFRFLNASISRGYDIALSTGGPMTIIGHEGGLAPRPVDVGSFRLGMAERYEVVIDFARYKIGERVDLINTGLPNIVDYASTRNIMRFQVAGEATDRRNNSIPQTLNPNKKVMGLKESDAERTRKWVFKRDNGLWTINGRIWDKNRVDARVPFNDVEIWELENSGGGWFHPVHIHLIDFKILDRDGRPPFPWERGPKDVAYIGENETVRVIARFGPRRGRYMMHCHNLVHEDHDMMTQFEVGVGGPNPMTAARPKNVSLMRPF